MAIDTAAHSVIIQDGDYAGTYAISDENWLVYPSGVVFSWSGETFQLQGSFSPYYELPTRSGGLVIYQKNDEGNFEIADLYKLWKESESGGSTIATPYQVHTDQIGAPILLTDATGTAVWSAQYAPFGQATINSDVDGDGTEVVCNLRFPGQYFDAESGLHYNWHRYYEPRSGRYITLDPIGLDGGINLYAYVENNPSNYRDPWGLISGGPRNYWEQDKFKECAANSVGFAIALNDFSRVEDDRGCTYFCWSLTTDLVGIGGGAPIVSSANTSPVTITGGLGKYGSISTEPFSIYGEKGWSKPNMSLNVGVSYGVPTIFGVPVGVSARLICFLVSDVDDNGCPCSETSSAAPGAVWGTH
ncbi:RHS domain-containing protein [Desulfuromonas acetoxidans]|nr:RHS domain-containing protein [Desulfuromonas acetoxidans]NVE16699.1 RHS domain-containing protein [Desulfuromonas acetoxidans]